MTPTSPETVPATGQIRRRTALYSAAAVGGTYWGISLVIGPPSTATAWMLLAGAWLITLLIGVGLRIKGRRPIELGLGAGLVAGPLMAALLVLWMLLQSLFVDGSM